MKASIKYKRAALKPMVATVEYYSGKTGWFEAIAAFNSHEVATKYARSCMASRGNSAASRAASPERYRVRDLNTNATTEL